jgi:serine/threonine protein phosphatase PrpC
MSGSMHLIAKDIAASKDPLARAKQELLDKYILSEGVRGADVRKSAIFESIRSKVIQTVYEVAGTRGWLDELAIPKETTDAEIVKQRYLDNSMSRFVKQTGDPGSALNRMRVAMERRATTVERFVGSTRLHVPGAAYGISIRKRHGINQDSFIIEDYKGTAVMGVADGCGAQTFSSIASFMSTDRIRGEALLSEPLDQICTISAEIARVVNGIDMTNVLYGGGTSTLVAGLSRGSGRDVFKVGDSAAFSVFHAGEPWADVQTLGRDDSLRTLLGQRKLLSVIDIETFTGDNEQIILASDGITEFLPDPAGFIQGIVKMTSDCVLIAEKVVREVLKNQMARNESADATIVVQDAGPSGPS